MKTKMKEKKEKKKGGRGVERRSRGRRKRGG